LLRACFRCFDCGFGGKINDRNNDPESAKHLPTALITSQFMAVILPPTQQIPTPNVQRPIKTGEGGKNRKGNYPGLDLRTIRERDIKTLARQIKRIEPWRT